MNNKEFAEQELVKQTNREKLQVAYDRYIESGDKDALEEFLELVRMVHSGYAYSVVYDKNMQEDLLQEVCINLQTYLKAIRAGEKDPVGNLNAFIRSSIRRKNTDMWRKDSDRRIYEGPLSDDEDAPVSELDASPKRFGEPDDPNDPSNIVLASIRGDLKKSLIALYGYVLMTHRKLGIKQAITVMYSVLIPYFEGRMTSNRFSPAWAWETIKEQTFQELTDDSETTIQEKLTPELAWAERYRKLLEENTGTLSPDMPMGKAIPRDVMTLEKVQDWSNEHNPKLAKAVLTIVKSKPDLVDLAREDISRQNKKYATFLYGGVE